MSAGGLRGAQAAAEAATLARRAGALVRPLTLSRSETLTTEDVVEEEEEEDDDDDGEGEGEPVREKSRLGLSRVRSRVQEEIGIDKAVEQIHRSFHVDTDDERREQQDEADDGSIEEEEEDYSLYDHEEEEDRKKLKSLLIARELREQQQEQENDDEGGAADRTHLKSILSARRLDLWQNKLVTEKEHSQKEPIEREYHNTATGTFLNAFLSYGPDKDEDEKTTDGLPSAMSRMISFVDLGFFMRGGEAEELQPEQEEPTADDEGFSLGSPLGSSI